MVCDEPRRFYLLDRCLTVTAWLVRARRRVKAVNGIAERVVDTNGRVGVGEDGGDVPGERGVVRLCVLLLLLYFKLSFG